MNSSLFSDPADSASEFAVQIDTVVSDILDAHCPKQTRTKLVSSSTHRDNRWLSQDAINAKRERRRLERLWRTHGHEHDRAAYRKACRVANKAINASRRDQYAEKIRSSGSDSRKRWSAIRDVLHSSGTVDVQEGDRTLCETFAAFSTNKIRSVKAAIAASLTGREIDSLRADGTFRPKNSYK